MSSERRASDARSSPGELDWPYLYERHGPELSAFAYRLTGDAEVAADLVQDTFVRAMRRQGTLLEPSAVRAWLYRIASNLVTDRRRRERLVAFVPFVGTEREPERATDTAALVRKALREIPVDHAVALVLAYHDGFTRKEIARLLGIPEETVKTRIHRGRKRFEAAYVRLETGRRP